MGKVKKNEKKKATQDSTMVHHHKTIWGNMFLSFPSTKKSKPKTNNSRDSCAVVRSGPRGFFRRNGVVIFPKKSAFTTDLRPLCLEDHPRYP